MIDRDFLSFYPNSAARKLMSIRFAQILQPKYESWVKLSEFLKF